MRLSALPLLALLLAGPALGEVLIVPPPDSSVVAPDSTAAESTRVVAPAPVVAPVVAPAPRPVAPRPAAAPAPEPPYRIEADRMTGGRGPTGDVLFLEQVTITRGRTRLQSERGRYERATGMVHVEGRVRMRDSSTTVTCDEASFSETQDRLDLRGNVVVVDRDARLQAPYGWYDRRTGKARLHGGVRGQERKQRLVAREAFYDRDSSTVIAIGDVIGDDDENRTRIEAQRVEYDRRSKVATATGAPLLRARDDDGHETRLRARLLRVGSESKVAEALDSVEVERDTLRARADYARFDDALGRGLLLGSPRAWDGETTISGDTLETVGRDRKLDRILVRGRAGIDYTGAREGTRGDRSRLTGEQVEMYVTGSRIDSLVATGQARNTYTAAAKPGKTPEDNLAEGDTILVFFKDKRIDRARVVGGATGAYRPPVAVDDTTAARLERITYQATGIVFEIPRNRIVLDGQARLLYRDLELSARRVEFDSRRNTLVAEGQPSLVEKGDEVEGQLMTYDMEQQVGTIYQATTQYERGLYHGKRIRKVSERELDVLGGSYSTCDLAEPHYHFSARWMKIYLKDKLVAKPVVFYVRNVPVLALPFYVFPIKPGRHSGFLFPQFEFGFNSTSGQFIRNAGYYWAPNDYFDFTGAGDYYAADPSWLLRGELNYKLLYRFEGRADVKFGHDERTGRDDYTFSGTHQQTIGQRTRLSALGNFTSSRDFSTSGQSGQSFQQRFDRFLNSNLQLTHYADGLSLSAILDRRQDLDADDDLLGPTGALLPVGTVGRPSLTVYEPSLTVSLPQRTLGSYGVIKDNAVGRALKNTYLSLNARYLGYRTERAFVEGVYDTAGVLTGSRIGRQRETRRAATSQFALSDSRRLLGWINFSPSVFGNAVVFDRDEQGKTVVPAAVWQSGVGVSTTLYRTLSTPIEGLAFRHVVSPSVQVSYAPDFPGLSYTDENGILRPRFKGFADVNLNAGRRSTVGSFTLDQRLQAKLTRGERVTRLDNLLSWTTSGSYDFLWRENGRSHGLSALSSALRLQPPGWVNADANAIVDPYEGRPLRSLGYNVYTSFGNRGGGRPQASRSAADSDRGVSEGEEAQNEFRDNWTVSLAYSSSGGYFGSSWSSREALNAVFRYQLTEGWLFDYSAGYDLTDRRVQLQRFNLTRRIHCWDATFTRSFTPGGETEYYLRFGIREQREIYLERGTRVQSFGGIQ